MGAGISLFDSSKPITLVVSAGGGGVGSPSPILSASPSPRVNVSVERRLTERNWLVTGLSAAYSSTDTPLAPTSPGGGSSVRVKEIVFHGLAAVGLRRAMIAREGVPVVGSLQGMVHGGFSSNSTGSTITSPAGAGTSRFDLEQWSLGVTGAIVVDGHLNDFVSLRVATNVVRLSGVSSTTRTVAGTNRAESTGTALEAAATFEPTLELRVFF